MLTDKNFIKIAYEVASWSKCISKKVWCIIVKDNRILSTWYNWTPSWYTNCDDYMRTIERDKHHEWSYKYEIHAEMNAIARAARNWIKIEWATSYSTYQPCFDCTRAMLATWIKKMIYKEKYKHYTWNDAENFVKECWWKMIQLRDLSNI